MISAPPPDNETERVKFLHHLGILDTDAEQAFDELAQLASHICDTPIALVSLVDTNRQWFKSRIGFEVQETPRDVSFCAHAILQSDAFIVTDTLTDNRFAGNPLVLNDPKIRFYAGVPLKTSNGFAPGTLCVIDYKPHELSQNQIDALQVLGNQVVAQLELRHLTNLQKQAVAEILELNAVLETRVKERTAALETANHELVIARERAEMASRAKSTFLATMSHELRTPLNGVLGMAELLKMATLSDRHHEWLESLHLSGNRLLYLIDNVLQFSEIESGNLRLAEEPFQLDLLLESVLKPVRSEAKAKGLSLSGALAPGISKEVIGDFNHLKQILAILVGNAIKFTEHGSVEITIAPEVKASPMDAACRTEYNFKIADSGIGMTAENLETLFQPFVQADSSSTRRFGGAGLGLAICDQLVRRMGGELRVVSTPGHGSTFHFSLSFPVVIKKP